MSTFNIGQPELRPYIVAIRLATEFWPEQYDDAIAEARRRYDGGSHIMCQGRDGVLIIQYLIPREKPQIPGPAWFVEPWSKVVKAQRRVGSGIAAKREKMLEEWET